MKPRTPIRRASLKRLAANGGKLFSTAKRSSEQIKKVNVEATRKRRLRNQKRMRSPEYKAARAGAMERAGGRCEFVTAPPRWSASNIYGPSQVRCADTGRLQFHEEHYASLRGIMVCPPHHRFLESLKPHKQQRRGF